MIDISHEKLLTVDQAAERFGVTRKAVFGWMKQGRERQLESCKIGGKRYTSLEAVQRFSEQSGCAVQPRCIETDYQAGLQLMNSFSGRSRQDQERHEQALRDLENL